MILNSKFPKIYTNSKVPMILHQMMETFVISSLDLFEEMLEPKFLSPNKQFERGDNKQFVV
jgi:hypothetical protein